eukprot:NODE_6918_length_473_cov_333.423445.p2 GENE.NODE_6918_length_473_cov_333.423445~~NODE_6918_length_473_cov_333.423445.p2  ORF type:complete len:104 (+),score=20.72 NODE_6918_length_473_cov_333.423445:3-314(+)
MGSLAFDFRTPTGDRRSRSAESENGSPRSFAITGRQHANDESPNSPLSRRGTPKSRRFLRPEAEAKKRFHEMVGAMKEINSEQRLEYEAYKIRGGGPRGPIWA